MGGARVAAVYRSGMDEQTPGEDAQMPDDVWPELEPAPTQFVAFWPHPEPPSSAEVSAALGAWLDQPEPLGEEVSVGESGMSWAIECEVDGVANAVAVWCERALEVDEAWRTMLGAAAECRWVIRLQTVLDEDDGADEYFLLLNLLAGSIADAVGVLDVTTGQFLPRSELDREVLAEDAVPIDRLLWRIVRLPGVSDAAEVPSTHVSICTVGLCRLSRPELELLEVPVAHALAAEMVLDTLVPLIMEDDLPLPGQPVEIGDGMVVSLVPLASADEFVEEANAGSRAWRERIAGIGIDHVTLPRVAVCSPHEKGAFKKAWVWPAEAAAKIEEGNAVLYLAQREVDANARQAQRTFPLFATAFASLARSDAPAWRDLAQGNFLVQAPVGGIDGDDRIEQVWYSVHHLDGDGVDGQLLERPRTRPELDPGSHHRIDREAVSGWSVELPSGTFRPSDCETMLEAVDRVRESIPKERDAGAGGLGAPGASA